MDDTFYGDLRIVGGHPALCLVNTVAPRAAGATTGRDFLPEPSNLLAWAALAGIVNDGEAAAVASAWRAGPDDGATALRAAVDVREAAYAILAARLGVPAAEPEPRPEQLMRHWSAAAARTALSLDCDVAATQFAAGAAPAARLQVGIAPAMMIPDRLAGAAVELLTSVDVRGIKPCPVAEGGCGFLFLDLSRNGSRRWCAMADCGTQSKSRRLTERRRATRRTPRI